MIYLQTLLHRKVMIGWIPITVATFVSYKKKETGLSELLSVFSKKQELIGVLPKMTHHCSIIGKADLVIPELKFFIVEILYSSQHILPIF